MFCVLFSPRAGIRGVRLGKELMSVAANGLKTNMTRLGPLVLPLSEQLLFAGNMVARMLLGPKKVKPYVPDFGLAFDHICLHTGEGRWYSRGVEGAGAVEGWGCGVFGVVEGWGVAAWAAAW